MIGEPMSTGLRVILTIAGIAFVVWLVLDVPIVLGWTILDAPDPDRAGGLRAIGSSAFSVTVKAALAIICFAFALKLWRTTHHHRG